MLRQLGNSFIVQPNVLKSYLTEGHLGRIDSRLLRPYLSQRSDWTSFNRTLVLDDGLPADAPRESSIASTSGHGHQGSGLGSGGGSTVVASSSVTNGGFTTVGGVLKSPNPKAGSRFSTMSGVAGAGMGKLREMLKDFETYSPEEVEALKKLDANRATGGRPDPGPNVPAPVYFGMHY